MKFLLLSALLFVVSKAQDACEWYYWNSGDWPSTNETTSQDFRTLMNSQGIGQYYFDSTDFNATGRFYGKVWEDEFWTDHLNYRPMGFRYASVGANNDPTVCLNVNGTGGYKVELMIYTLTKDANLCASDMSADNYNTQDTGATSVCDEQYIYTCFTADTSINQMQVAIYCGENCEDSTSIEILWRFRRSSLTWEDSREFSDQNPEMWCNMIASNIEWPDEIEEAVPAEYYPESNLSSANMISGLIALVFASIVTLWQ